MKSKGAFGNDDELISIFDKPKPPASRLSGRLVVANSLDWVAGGKYALVTSLWIARLLNPKHGLSRVEDWFVEQGDGVCFHSLRR